MQIKGVYICDCKACSMSCKADKGCIRTFNEDHAVNKDAVELVHLIEEKFNIVFNMASDPAGDKLYFIEKSESEE